MIFMVYQQIYWQCEVCSKNAQMCKGLRGSEEFKLKLLSELKLFIKQQILFVMFEVM